MKKFYGLLLTGICFLITNLTYAQAGLKIWDKRFGGTVSDGINSIISTADGGYLLGGYSVSGANGDKSQASQGSYDYWVVKIDGSGNKVWDKRFGGTSGEVLNSLIATTDGSYLLGGSSESGVNGDKSQNPQGGSDYWVVKIDGSGNKVWDKRFGGTDDDYMYSTIATADGGYLLGGESLSEANGDKSQASQGSNDYWVVKIDGNGNKVWDKRFGGTSDDGIKSMKATADGGYLLGGLSYSGANGDKSQASQGDFDYWVVKIDGIGNKVWDKRFGGTDYDVMLSIIASADGGYLLGGLSISGANGDKSQASQGDADYWVVKIDGIGNKVWDKRFGGTSGDGMRSIIATADGGYLLGGVSGSGANGDKTQASQGNSDYWVVKIDGIGNKVWDKRFGGANNEILFDMIATADGGYLLGGTSDSGANGDKTQASQGNSDYWVVKISGDCSLTAGITPSTTQNTCAGSTLAFSGSSTGGTSPAYAWSSSPAGFNSTQQNPSFTTPTVTQSTNYVLTLTVTSAGCTATATTTVTVSPTPTVNTVSNQTVTVGGTTSAINFGGAVPNTTYSWTNNNPSIGLAASGTGNIPAFTATNLGTVSQVATITVTPSTSSPGCTGGAGSFTITVTPPPSTNTVQLEYFIDADPGYGSGTSVSLTAGNPVTVNFPVSLTASADGFHFLSLRAKDGYNNWSVVAVRPFYKETLPTASLPNITALEYFLDADPGYGLATSVAVAAGSPVSQSFMVALPNTVADGFHFLSIRAKDVNNKWSVVGVRPFYKETIPTATIPNITVLEYFLDADPGYGLATSVAITPSSPVTQSFTVALPNTVADGFHYLSVRARDISNKWSVIAVRPFYKETLPATGLPNITAMEYFIDNDTGFGNGTAVTGFTAGTNVNSNFTVTLGSLTNGSHKLYLRAKDINNRWSIVGVRPFTVQDNIIIVGTIPTEWCVNTVFNIPFTISGTYTVGNIFTAQLSDVNGNFTSPATIGTLTSTNAGTISATVPNGTSLGDNYQIRVISSTPSITNTDGKTIKLVSICPPPCEGLITLLHPADDILSGNITKQASATNGSISASNYVQGNGTRATYQAKSILLSAGFRADSGTIFKAEVGGCNN